MTMLRHCIPVLACLAFTASAARAQNTPTVPPEPLALGTPYIYQPGNPYWYQPLTYYPAMYAYPSPFPFGSTSPVFGRYSWDYGVAYPVAYSPAVTGWFWSPHPVYSAGYTYPPLPGRVWVGFGW
jgi:hypothetical protein